MISLDTFHLDPALSGTLQSRIQQLIAQGILNGRFRPGDRLPSSRQLARHLGVSRITVTLAYTELVADDYLTARPRSGYTVSANAPEASVIKPFSSFHSTVDWPKKLGPAVPSLGLVKPPDWAGYRYNFIYGQADPTLFDSANWRLCALQALGKKDFSALTADQYDQDDPLLIDFITRQTLPRRGILASPDEVLLTLGAQNALWLTAQILLTPNKHAVIEDPGYPSLRAILQQRGCRLTPLAVDSDGLDPATIPPCDVAFVTPSHQCPTTATMPAQRRQALLDKAESDDFLIVEDDYDFEMAFLRPPFPALKSLDRQGRVIHIGSFSKSIFPGLRLGYLVGPAPFIAQARALRAQVLRHPPGHIQRTTAYFLSLGHYDALIRRMNRAYLERRRVLDTAIAHHGLEVAGGSAPQNFGGSSLWMRARGTDTTALAARLRSQGVLIEPGAPFFALNDPTANHPPGATHPEATPPTDFYRLAYSSIPAGRIADGVGLVGEEMYGTTK